MLRTVTIQPRGGSPSLQAELWDGSGSVDVVGIGRRRIAGIEPGRVIRAEGRMTDLKAWQNYYRTLAAKTNEPVFHTFDAGGNESFVVFFPLQSLNDWCTSFNSLAKAANPAYDAAGNMTSMPQPAAPGSSYTATYDAWNRLVKVSNAAGDELAEYQYDGQNRKTVSAQATPTPGTLDNYTYSSALLRCVVEDPERALDEARRRGFWKD